MKIVIFAGGVGTRLWPLSRKNTPKQFGKIVGEKSTVQLAVDRVMPISKPSDIFISSGLMYKDTLFEQLPQIPRENFILEPEMRDVGAAVGLVTAIFEKKFPDEPMIILWSDHMVKNEGLFRDVLSAADSILKKDGNKIVFIGQSSRFASQNLGWIEFGEEIGREGEVPVFKFKSFHYAPPQDLAETFHKSEKHVWNPGYFGTTPKFLMSLYKKYGADMSSLLDKLSSSFGTSDFQDLMNEHYPKLEKISFDNLILEKIDPSVGLVVRADLGWSDVGAWESLKEALEESEDENVTRGNVIIEDSKDTLVFNYTNQTVVGIDLSEVLVINTDDVILICPKNSVPKIKKLVNSLAGTKNEHLT
jgi:mannose-1-phosphate guanylyltransferase